MLTLSLQGIKWKPDEHGVIAFDCRNRKWYIQAATSPKNVVILVDVSGSMKGLRLSIAKQTVSSILDTLGDDDFFNIIAVSQRSCNINYLTSIFLYRFSHAHAQHTGQHPLLLRSEEMLERISFLSCHAHNQLAVS